MKAVRYSQYGGPEVLQIAEIDKPSLKDGQILVEVKASAINPFDWKVRKGLMKDSIPLDLPITIGSDFAGIVEEVPAGIEAYKPGDEVYGSANVLNGSSGSMAECAAVNTTSVALKPGDLNFTEAAAIVLVGVSTIQALDQMNLSEGKKILIHGGAGGIGSSAIQYAKHLRAYVATTARADDIDFVKNLGADEVIDYESRDFSEVVKDFDAVFDTVGGETYKKSFGVLKEGGIIVSMVMPPDEELAGKYSVKAVLMSSKVNTDSLNRLKELVEQDIIKPQVDKAFPLSQAAKAYDHQENGSPKGKVVVEIS